MNKTEERMLSKLDKLYKDIPTERNSKAKTRNKKIIKIKLKKEIK